MVEMTLMEVHDYDPRGRYKLIRMV